jgi:LETM1 and EF-hand domain-containing protein 1
MVLLRFLASLPGRINEWRAMSREDWAKWRSETWATIKHEAHHYWVSARTGE